MAKAVYLSPYFWPEQIGSAPYATDVARWLVQHGQSVEVLAFRPHYPSPDGFEAWAGGARDREMYEGMSIQRTAVNARGGGGFLRRLSNDVRFLAMGLKRALQPGAKVETVVAYVPSCLTLFAARAIALRSKARVIAVVHDIESGLAAALDIAKSREMLRVMRAVERRAFNLADELVVLTDGMADELRALGVSRPIRTLPIWADVFPFRDLPGDAHPTVCYSGNFGRKQNLDQLLPVLRLLQDRLPHTKVLLRGEGSERPRIEARVREMGLSNTTFGPLVASEQFVRSLQDATVHLIPQAVNVANYALPSKVFSVMAAGRPFVCIANPDSPLGGLSRASKGGFCVGPGDDEALFQVLAKLLASPEYATKVGQQGRRYVLENMGRELILERYYDLIVRPTTTHRGVDAGAQSLGSSVT